MADSHLSGEMDEQASQAECLLKEWVEDPETFHSCESGSISDSSASGQNVQNPETGENLQESNSNIAGADGENPRHSKSLQKLVLRQTQDENGSYGRIPVATRGEQNVSGGSINILVKSSRDSDTKITQSGQVNIMVSGSSESCVQINQGGEGVDKLSVRLP